MTIKRSLIFIALIPLVLQAFAQKGTLLGKIIDKEFGDELTGVQVYVAEIKSGGVTDLDGNYNLELNAGSYTVSFSYIGMAKQTIKNVKIKAGEVTRLNISMSENVEMAREVVVDAEAVRNTDVSVLNMQRKSVSVQDNISGQHIKRLGVSNAASAMKQVTGASVEGGKFMVMRGLGDRYSITQMNGVTLPSTDPYRNSSSIDLIPAGMIENIVTSKTFTPDMPGNFTGGNVNIATKSFPDRRIMSFSLSGGYNTQASFNKNFLSAPGGKLDWLGYDDGTRKLADVYIENKELMNNSFYILARNPKNPELREKFNQTARGMRSEAFVNELNPSGMNNSFSFTYGDKHKLGETRRLGYIIGINGSRDFSYYENGQSNAYKVQSGAAEDLIDYYELSDRKASQNANVGGMANITYQWNTKNRISLNTMYNHDGEKVVREQNGSARQMLSNPDAFFYTSINYLMERQLFANQLTGEHELNDKGWELTWVAGYTNSTLKQPDMKMFAYKIDKGESAPKINPSEFDMPSSFFRNLVDNQYQAKVDLEIPLKVKGKKSDNMLKFGGAISHKTREFAELRYRVAQDGVDYDVNSPYYTENALRLRTASSIAAYFDPSNFGMVDEYVVNGQVRRYLHSNFIFDQTRDENLYTGRTNVAALYAMGAFELTNRLKLIGGARMETTDILVVSEATDTDGNNITGSVYGIDILPSLNAVYKLNSESNLRFAATQTLARPNMRELAPFAALDFIGGFIYEGTPNIKRTKITNLDLRWEMYPNAKNGKGELIAVSGFYKHFKDPIIRVFDPLKPNPTINFNNVDKATVYGVEIEFRKALGQWWNSLENFQLSTNVSLIYSVSPISPDELAAARNNNPDFPATRPFQAQSPYLINANLTYDNDSVNIESTLSFNLFGPRLAQVGTLGTPDIYERPIPTLNWNISKGFGKHWSMTLKVNNILNATYQTYQVFRDQKYIVSEFRIGLTTSLGVSYKL